MVEMPPGWRQLMLVTAPAFLVGAGARLISSHHHPHDAPTQPTTAPRQATGPLTPRGPSDSAPVQDGAASPNTPSKASESVDGILEARGLEQAERLGRFLVSATPADLERLLFGLRWQMDGIPETLQDAIFLRWMSVDPAGGRAIASRLNLQFIAGWAWGKTDPEAAFAAARADTENLLGIAVLRAIAQTDPQRARALLEQNPRFRESGSMDGLADGLMRTDPAGAATLGAAWNPSVNRGNLLTDWARRDPDAAFEWARSLPEFSRRTEALKLLIDQWQQRDPERAASALDSLPEGRAKWDVLAQQAARLADDDPQAALAYVQALPNELLKREASIEIARQLATTDADAALALLTSCDWPAHALTPQNPPPLEPGAALTPTLPENAYTALEMIGSSRPAEALAFLATLPEEAQGFAVQGICQPWMRRDPLAYSQWLAEQPESAMRAQATRILIDRLVGGRSPDFDAAFQWSLTLPEAGANPMAKRILSQWSQNDPEAARAALQAPSVPESLRSALDASPDPTLRQP